MPNRGAIANLPEFAKAFAWSRGIPVIPVHHLAGERCDHDGAATPDAARIGDAERQEDDDDEQAAHDVRFLGGTRPLVSRRLHDRAGDARRLRDLDIGGGDLLVERLDLRIDAGDPRLDAGAIRATGQHRLLLEPFRQPVTRLLQLSSLAGELRALRHPGAVDGRWALLLTDDGDPAVPMDHDLRGGGHGVDGRRGRELQHGMSG